MAITLSRAFSLILCGLGVFWLIGMPSSESGIGTILIGIILAGSGLGTLRALRDPRSRLAFMLGDRPSNGA